MNLTTVAKNIAQQKIYLHVKSFRKSGTNERRVLLKSSNQKGLDGVIFYLKLAATIAQYKNRNLKPRNRIGRLKNLNSKRTDTIGRYKNRNLRPRSRIGQLKNRTQNKPTQSADTKIGTWHQPIVSSDTIGRSNRYRKIDQSDLSPTSASKCRAAAQWICCICPSYKHYSYPLFCSSSRHHTPCILRGGSIVSSFVYTVGSTFCHEHAAATP